MSPGPLRVATASRSRVALVAVLLAGAAVGSGLAVGALGSPEVVAVTHHFGSVTQETTTVHTAVVVHNPNPVGLALADLSISHAVELAGIRLAEGARRGVDIPPGTSTVAFESAVDNDRIREWWVAHLRAGERSEMTVDVRVSSTALDRSVDAPRFTRTVETDIASAFNDTERRGVGVDGGPVLYVERTRGWWESVSADETTIRMQVAVSNPNPYDVPIQAVGYGVRMNGLQVGAGRTDRSSVVPAGGTRTVDAAVVLDNNRLDEWWVSHLRRGQVTELAVDVSVVVDLSAVATDGPTVAVPLLTVEHTVETDVFGTDDERPSRAEGAPARLREGSGWREGSGPDHRPVPVDTFMGVDAAPSPA